jgi:hypothetical protein
MKPNNLKPDPDERARKHRTLIIVVMIVLAGLPLLLGLARLMGRI